MKLTAEKKTELVESLLALLDHGAEELPKRPSRYDRIIGKALLKDHKLTKDGRGDPIKENVWYDWPVFVPRLVNHKGNIGQIIADADSEEVMETRLAEYLAKYSASPQSPLNHKLSS